MDYANTVAQQNMGRVSAAGAPNPRKQTTADGLVTDLRQMATRAEQATERLLGLLQRMGVAQPPSIGGQKCGAEVAVGLFGEIAELANRIRAAQTDAENFLSEIENHI